MSKYQQFIFDSYQFDPSAKTLELRYSLDDQVHFTEVFGFNFEFTTYNGQTLDRACQALFFMAGVSYYKTYLPAEIVVRQGEVDQATAAFLSKTYQRGLGEFFFVNQLDPHTPITFPTNIATITPAFNQGKGQLVGVGGGKDSLVSIELLRNYAPDMVTWSAGHQAQLAPLVERIGLPHCWVERTWDRQLLDINTQPDAYNGHIPISGVLACAGIVAAVLSGKRDVVVSNEKSANEPTLHYQGMDINHQYSKSQEFEQDFQQYLTHLFGDTLRYYSLLRPLSELRIAEVFAKVGFEKYKAVFSSCNRAFTHTSDHMWWCGECPKCAFVFLALTPFIAREELEALWGKNLLLDPALEPTYRQLLGIEGDKPLECVGEVKESRSAMRLAFQYYPELQATYQFDIPEDYDYKAEGSNEMPKEIAAIFDQAMLGLGLQ